MPEVFEEEKNKEIIPIFLKKEKDIIEKIKEMNLPVSDWEIMEKEIEQGALDE
ncbi:MAG: hypothetical protein ACE5KT_11595 [Methanosarcinales archaeon]